MTDFELSDLEKHQTLWFRIKTHLEDRLADARRRNDASLSEADTAALRGEIKCLKRLIALGDDRPLIVTGDGDQPP